MAGISHMPAWHQWPCKPLATHLTWVVKDLCVREDAGCTGELPQSTMHAVQLRWVCQDSAQALTGLATGT